VVHQTRYVFIQEGRPTAEIALISHIGSPERDVVVVAVIVDVSFVVTAVVVVAVDVAVVTVVVIAVDVVMENENHVRGHEIAFAAADRPNFTSGAKKSSF